MKAGQFVNSERLFKTFFSSAKTMSERSIKYGILLAQMGRFERRNATPAQAISLGIVQARPSTITELS